MLIHPRNFLTNPPKAGKVGKNTSFGGMVPYMEDNFNRPKDLATEARLAGKELEQDKPFSQMVKKTHVFNTNRAVIGEDRDYPHRKPSPKQGPLMEHDKPFRPSQPPKIGYNKCLAPFPKYEEDPLKFVERKPEEEDEKPRFKPASLPKTRPTPSVQTNLRNLKASFPSVFKR